MKVIYPFSQLDVALSMTIKNLKRIGKEKNSDFRKKFNYDKLLYAFEYLLSHALIRVQKIRRKKKQKKPGSLTPL